MEPDQLDFPEAHGGCQCGAVRFTITPGPGFASICHCRMCQRATGSPFAALFKVAANRVTWHGTPATFASSSIAERGFCSACGTPLFYRQFGSDSIELTSGSLPASFPFRPAQQWGIEGRHDWLAGLAIPGARTVEREVMSHQSKED